MRGEAKSTLHGVIVGVYVCPPSNARSISKDTPILGAKVAMVEMSVLFRMLQKLRSLTVGGATEMYKNNASFGAIRSWQRRTAAVFSRQVDVLQMRMRPTDMRDRCGGVGQSKLLPERIAAS